MILLIACDPHWSCDFQQNYFQVLKISIVVIFQIENPRKALLTELSCLPTDHPTFLISGRTPVSALQAMNPPNKWTEAQNQESSHHKCRTSAYSALIVFLYIQISLLCWWLVLIQNNNQFLPFVCSFLRFSVAPCTSKFPVCLMVRFILFYAAEKYVDYDFAPAVAFLLCSCYCWCCKSHSMWNMVVPRHCYKTALLCPFGLVSPSQEKQE